MKSSKYERKNKKVVETIISSIFAVVLVVLLLFMIMFTVKTIKINRDRGTKKSNAIPAPKNKVKKKKDDFEELFGRKEEVKKTTDYWYNKEDIENMLSHNTEDMYHRHFYDVEEAVIQLIIEMYDCAIVRTDVLKYTAFGIKTDVKSLKVLLDSEDEELDKYSDIEVSLEIKEQIFSEWCSYVEQLLNKVVIITDEEKKNQIIENLKEYGKGDIVNLLRSPE